jgi:hypothetical protein
LYGTEHPFFVVGVKGGHDTVRGVLPRYFLDAFVPVPGYYDDAGAGGEHAFDCAFDQLFFTEGKFHLEGVCAAGESGGQENALDYHSITMF